MRRSSIVAIKDVVNPVELLGGVMKAIELSDVDLIRAILARATELELDIKLYDPLRKGREIIDVCRKLDTARKERDLKTLQNCIQRANELHFQPPHPEKYTKMLSDLANLERDAQIQLDNMEEDDMFAVLQRASELGYESDSIGEIRGILRTISSEKLAEFQLTAAIELDNRDRIAHCTIRLRDLHMRRSAEQYNFYHYPHLRQPKQHRTASSDEHDVNEEQDHGTLVYSAYDLTAPLIYNDNPSYTDDAHFLFRRILHYFGDRVDETTSAAFSALQVIKKGLEDPSLRAEIYAQVVKQLTECPDEEHRQKGWSLLGLCIDTFPPPEEMENYLDMWVRQHADSSIYDKYLQVLHSTIYQGARTNVPSKKEVGRILNGHYYHLALYDGEFTPLDDIGKDASNQRQEKLNLLSPQSKRGRQHLEDRDVDHLNPDSLPLKATGKMYTLNEVEDLLRKVPERDLWMMAIDSSTGQNYYYHIISRRTIWEKPECLQMAIR